MNATAPAAPLAERVKHDRALQGISWTDLCQRARIARSTIHNWATASTPPEARTVNAVADVLGIDRAEALALAGIIIEPGADPEQVALKDISNEALLAEVGRRIRGR